MVAEAIQARNEEAARAVAARPNPMKYKHEGVIARMMKKENMDRETAELFFFEMLEFLVRCAYMDGTHRPTKGADIAWHNFILHTADYAHFCGTYFAKFIHHSPSRDECCDNSPELSKKACCDNSPELAKPACCDNAPDVLVM